MTPRQMLDTADRLVERPPASMRRCWQRACATLTRGALEAALRQFLHDHTRNAGERPRMRTLLLVLPQVASEDTAAIACTAWYGLCGAVHHHAYELAPTAAELRGWQRDVATVITELERSARRSS